MQSYRKLNLNVIYYTAIFSLSFNTYAEDLNRQPECLREQLAVDELLSQIKATSAPQGRLAIPGSQLSDPAYSGGNWDKWEYGRVDRTRKGGERYVMRYEITVHYMHNNITGQVSQVKLKNTKESGCTGVRVMASYVDMDGGDVLIARAPYDYNGGFDIVWSSRTAVITVGPLIESYADSGCVHVDSLLPNGRRAGDVNVGDTLELGDEKVFDDREQKFKSSSGVVTYSKCISAPGFRVTTSSGASLVCSATAPIPTHSGLVRAPRLLNHFVPVKTSIEGGARCTWEKVISVEEMGPVGVQHITVGDKCFWAGEKGNAFILHHNMKMIETGPSEAWWPWW
jgi:hypothetical protein